jgi:hypothetical protein
MPELPVCSRPRSAGDQPTMPELPVCSRPRSAGDRPEGLGPTSPAPPAGGSYRPVIAIRFPPEDRESPRGRRGASMEADGRRAPRSARPVQGREHGVEPAMGPTATAPRDSEGQPTISGRNDRPAVNRGEMAPATAGWPRRLPVAGLLVARLSSGPLAGVTAPRRRSVGHWSAGTLV